MCVMCVSYVCHMCDVNCHMCDIIIMTHSYDRWLIHMRHDSSRWDIIHPYAALPIHMWHDSSTRDTTHPCATSQSDSALIHMSHTYVSHTPHVWMSHVALGSLSAKETYNFMWHTDDVALWSICDTHVSHTPHVKINVLFPSRTIQMMWRFDPYVTHICVTYATCMDESCGALIHMCVCACPCATWPCATSRHDTQTMWRFDPYVTHTATHTATGPVTVPFVLSIGIGFSLWSVCHTCPVLMT